MSYHFQKVFLRQKLIYREFLFNLASSDFDKLLEKSFRKMRYIVAYRFVICYLILTDRKDFLLSRALEDTVAFFLEIGLFEARRPFHCDIQAIILAYLLHTKSYTKKNRFITSVHYCVRYIDTLSTLSGLLSECSMKLNLTAYGSAGPFKWNVPCPYIRNINPE
jgi:hypothetical protein